MEAETWGPSIYTVEFWQSIHKDSEMQKYIKLIQTESGLLLISLLISSWANISVPLPAVQKKRMILLSLSEQLFCVENNKRHGHSNVNNDVIYHLAIDPIQNVKQTYFPSMVSIFYKWNTFFQFILTSCIVLCFVKNILGWKMS